MSQLFHLSRRSIKTRLQAGALLAIALLATPPSQSQTASKIKTEEELVRENMISISRQLGVTCNTCHDPNNFKSDKKSEFKIAKEHIRWTQVLIDAGMNGKGSPKANCFVCHRGELKPPYQAPEAPLK